MEALELTPEKTLVGQLFLMDERNLGELLVRCENDKFLKPPKGKTKEEKLKNFEKLNEEFNQEVEKKLKAYTKYGLVKELMKWATNHEYDEVESYIQHEFDILKRAGSFYKIKPRATESFLDFERTIFEHWAKYLLDKVKEEIDKHPEKQDDMAVSLEKNLSKEEREKILKTLQKEGVVDKHISELRGKALLDAILNAGTGTGIMLLISSAGFEAYLILTKVIYVIFTVILGITLPFPVYLTATTALSWLLGPAGWVILGVITLLPIIKHRRKKKTALLALIFIPTVYLAYLKKIQSNKASEEEQS